MKNNLLVLFPYKFTNFEFFKYELEKFNFKIKILELSILAKDQINHGKVKDYPGYMHRKIFFN